MLSSFSSTLISPREYVKSPLPYATSVFEKHSIFLSINKTNSISYKDQFFVTKSIFQGREQSLFFFFCFLLLRILLWNPTKRNLNQLYKKFNKGKKLYWWWWFRQSEKIGQEGGKDGKKKEKRGEREEKEGEKEGVSDQKSRGRKKEKRGEKEEGEEEGNSKNRDFWVLYLV